MQSLIDDARQIYRAAVQGVQADVLLSRIEWESIVEKSFSDYNNIYVVGMGKAAMAMAATVEHELKLPIREGCIVIPRGYSDTLPYPNKTPQKIQVLEAAHPVPDSTSEEAAQVLLELADRCQEGDLLVVLISGGGSALTTCFAPGISLEEGQRVVNDLLRSGADIKALNTVRKHISMMGGGRLARRAMPAEVVSLVISDVVGDDLSTIASGPTVGDPSNPEDAMRVLRALDLWDDLPESVSNYLNKACNDPSLNTPTPDDPLYKKVKTLLIGSNTLALESACREATNRKYHVTICESWIEGEARDAGRELAQFLLNYSGQTPHCFIWGGETTVTVKGKGMGGRNQELALAAAFELDSSRKSVLLLSGGTDGIDGPTDAAGAWATPATIPRAMQRKRNPQAYLDANDAYTFFLEMNTLLKPGPTHTNVMDVVIGLIV